MSSDAPQDASSTLSTQHKASTRGNALKKSLLAATLLAVAVAPLPGGYPGEYSGSYVPCLMNTNEGACLYCMSQVYVKCLTSANRARSIGYNECEGYASPTRTACFSAINSEYASNQENCLHTEQHWTPLCS